MPSTLRDASPVPAMCRSWGAVVALLAASCLAILPARAQSMSVQSTRAQSARVGDAGASHGVVEDALTRIRRAGVLRIGLTGDYRPFSFRTPAGALEGADVAMARDFARAIGVRPVFVMTTWAALSGDFSAGRFDIAVGGVSIDPARARLGLFSQPYVSDGKRPVVRCADARRFTGIDAINRPDVRVVVNPGGTNERFARERLARAAITVFPDNTRIFDQIIAGKADVMVTDGVEVDLQSRLHPGVLCPAKVGAPFTHFDKAWLLPRDARFAATVNRFIGQEVKTGRWAARLRRAM